MAAKLADRLGDFALAYLAVFGVALVVVLARWPIVAVDTDLWYHLTAGRYIAAAHELPHSAFFSFMQPQPAWVDYYWLAQLGFYGVHSAAGYLGLVVLRGLLALGTAGLVLATLRLGRASDSWAWAAFVASAVVLFLLPRFAPVRPHDFSYLLIAAFLFLLESRRAPWLLPVLALLWVNLHGIEFPVMLLILGGYLGEWLLARLGLLPAVTPPPVLAFAAAGIAAACVLATPHGLALLRAPFTPLAFASQYIDELKPVALGTLVTLGYDGLLVTRETLLAFVLVGGVIAALASLERASLRPAHLVLFAGGFFLLTRIQRFSAEFVLLAVPLLGAFAARVTLPRLHVAARAAVTLALAVLALRHLAAAAELRCEYPLCTRGLPVGSAAFLRAVGATGAVFNHPNDGGYLEWELQPRQPVFADLQTPFLFSDEAIFLADQAFQDPEVLASVVTRYHPAYFAVPKSLRPFSQYIARFPEYVPVFVDDMTVLYANSAAQPEIAATHRLVAIEPFALDLADPSRGAESLAKAAEELARMNRIYAGQGRIRVFEGLLALERGDFALAHRIADEVTRERPNRPDGYRLRGEVLLAERRVAEAATAFEAALARSDEPGAAAQRLALSSRLWVCYSTQGRKEEAYRALRDGLPSLYGSDVSQSEIESLAGAALDAGRSAEGKTLLEFALVKTPPDDAETRRRLEARLRGLEGAR